MEQQKKLIDKNKYGKKWKICQKRIYFDFLKEISKKMQMDKNIHLGFCGII